MKSLILAGLFMGLGGLAVAKEPKVHTVRVRAGKIAAIRLYGNPTTGFQWELKSIDREIAEPVGEIAYSPNTTKPGLVGVGGLFSLKVRGVKPGETEAVLVYRRSWEKVEPIQTYKAKIKVRP